MGEAKAENGEVRASKTLGGIRQARTAIDRARNSYRKESGGDRAVENAVLDHLRDADNVLRAAEDAICKPK